MNGRIVIGSRGSKLALVQAQLVKTRLQLLSPPSEVTIEIIKTSGDVKPDPLSVIGGKGVFTKELEDALLDGRIDIAVHSLKDVPTIIPDALVIAAICKREDPRDALVLRRTALSAKPSINGLPKGAIIGTSSPRRLAQLKHLRPDLVFKDLRGNVDTRLSKLDEGHYDGLILACAGLRRLERDDRISAPLSTTEMLPAVGQGAIAIEARSEDAETIATVGKLDHKFTRLACTAERAFLLTLGGGCLLPIAAYGVVRDKRLRLHGLVAEASGKRILRDSTSGSLDDALQLGSQLAEKLLTNGASDLLSQESTLPG
jgi:hydroxymethylbilane synthase